MSTKIYNGFRIKTASFTKVQQLLAPVRHRMIRFGERAIAIKQAEIVTDIIDSKRLGLFPSMTRERSKRLRESQDKTFVIHPRYEAMEIVQERWKSIEGGQREPEFDINCEWSFIPHGSHVLGIIYTEQSAHTHWWFKVDGVEDYSYWDNSDKPDKVSARAWTNRRNDWDAALGSKAPIEVGFAASLFGKYSLPLFAKSDELIKHIPPLDKRAKEMAARIVSKQFRHNKKESFPFGRFNQWFTKPETKVKISEKAKQLESCLMQVITAADITTDIEFINPRKK